MSINPSGQSFYCNNEGGTDEQPHAMSPLRKRSRPRELQDTVKSTLKNNMAVEGDGCFGEKKTKYIQIQEYQSNDDFFNVEINNSLFSLPVKQDPVLDKLDNPDVKDQAALIVISTSFFNFSTLKKENIRAIILDIAGNNQLDTNSKCAELGILYFYIACKELLNDSNFVQYRTQELWTEANSRITEHETCCPEHLRKQIPSGTKGYLLYAFARMIFPSDGGFNPGGCKALKIMMEGRLQTLITEEERQQIIRITDRLLNDTEFVQLFLKPFSIHKDLQELISMDLQLNENEEIDSIYARWDLFIALISSFIQHDGEKNCFAIATAANLLVNNPEIPLKMLIEALNTGQMEFSECKFPVSTMLEGAIMNESGFDNVMHIPSVSNLISFSHLRDSLGVEKRDERNRRIPLENFLTELYGEKTRKAKLRYLSFRQNLLQKLLISMVQFAAINTNSKDFYKEDDLLLSVDKNQLEQFSSKESLIYRFIEDLKQYLKVNSNGNSLALQDDIYLDALEKVFLENLYLVDYNNWKVTHDNKKVSLNFHNQGLNFNGKRSDYNGLKLERRLCFFKNGGLIPVDSISELKSCFLEIVNQFQPDLKVQSQPKDCLQPKIIDFICSEVFEEVVSKYLFELNKKETPIEAAIYKDSDSFILAQNGCYDSFLKVWKPIRYRFDVKQIKVKSVNNFFIKLCVELAILDKRAKGNFAKSKNWLLIECMDHLYNICPHMFQEYWADEFKESWGTKDSKFSCKVLDPTIFSRLKNCEFTSAKRERIVQKVVGNSTMQNKFKFLIVSDLDVVQFCGEAKKLLEQTLHDKLDNAINTVMNEIPVKDIKEHLKTILSDIVDISGRDDCQKRILECIELPGWEYYSPYSLAEALHDALLFENFPQVPSRNLIEKRIRKWACLPEVIDIGNMNWGEIQSDKPSFDYLSLRYDFTKGLSFCYRRNGVERAVSDKDVDYFLKTTQIYLPKVM